MIGPPAWRLLVAAHSLRSAAHDAAARALVATGAAVAIAVAAVCLTCSAYILLARNIDPAGAGPSWALQGLAGLSTSSGEAPPRLTGPVPRPPYRNSEGLRATVC